MVRISGIILLAVCSVCSAGETRVDVAFVRLPLAFEANQGQSRSGADFLARGRGYTVLLTAEGAEIRFRPKRLQAHSAMVRLRVLGANQAARPEAFDPFPGKVNYYRGSDPAGWRTGIPTFAKVRYRELYAGIDMVYYGKDGELEYDFAVRPGADPSRIELEFSGVERTFLEGSGDLILSASGSEFRFHRPVVYQVVSGVKRQIEGAYRLLTGNRIRFEVASYDRSKPLIIDPVLTYGAVIGGSGWEFADYHGKGLATDRAGNLYVTGATWSADFPAAAGAPPNAGNGDVFLAKLSADGTKLLFSTVFGGSGYDQGNAVGVDPAGTQVVVAGYSNSPNFPQMNPVQAAYAGNDDAIVAGFSSSGSLVYSTYLGGAARDQALAVAVEGTGNAYVAGMTDSGSAFPGGLKFGTVATGGGDGFVASFSRTGGARYTGVLGGSGLDEARGIATAAGAAYVTGETCVPVGAPANFPVVKALNATARNCDAFLTRIGAAGAVEWSTFLGGTGNDEAWAVAVDSTGVYVAGITYADFPVTTGRTVALNARGYADSFVTKFKPDGSAIYSFLLGGNGNDFVFAIAVDAAGNPTVAGLTMSQDFPVTSDALQGTKLGTSEGVFTSTDGGTSWTAVPIHGFPNSTLLRQAPTNPATMYVSDGISIHRSDDGGLSFPGPGGGLPSVPNELVVDPVTATTLYAATQTSGVLRSTDAGVTWAPFGTGLPANATAIATGRDPAVLYAAAGAGVYMQTAGAWAPVAAPLAPASTVNRLLVDATAASTLYAVTDNAVFKSTTSGAAWQPLPASGCIHFQSLTIHPTQPQTLYMADTGRFCSSADGGATWKSTPIGISEPATAIAVDPAAASTIYVAAGTHGIYRSQDGGATWVSISGAAPFRLDKVNSLAVSGPNLAAGISTNPDIFLTKFNAAGESVFSTYLGGPGSVDMSGLAVDAANTYLAAPTAAAEFPVTAGAYVSPTARSNDVHVLKIANGGGPCTVSFRPASLVAEPGGGVGRVRVLSGSGCKWGTITAPPWMHPSVWGGIASGLGLIEFTYDPNTSGAPRAGNLAVGTQALAVTQAPAAAQ